MSDQAKHAGTLAETRDWFFTFGSAHAHPNGYVRIHGTFVTARDTMFKRYGAKWAFQYPTAEQAGVYRWNLTEVEFDA